MGRRILVEERDKSFLSKEMKQSLANGTWHNGSSHSLLSHRYTTRAPKGLSKENKERQKGRSPEEKESEAERKVLTEVT